MIKMSCFLWLEIWSYAGREGYIMNFSKEQLKQVSIILLVGIIGFVLGRYTAKPALKISAQVPDVSNEIAKSFGWAKAP
ncbi:MAG: hypothetical protein ACTFAL_07595 [Candidatus Electronema sp. V4]|uniref:hypothetical protein n=1 Tax=Candidatus Electronema sp. V4 TaxID=3454756 RepID=UPI0040557555